MERGGPFTGGENPEDPEGAGDDAGVPQRGWLSPEDRLWRHPSEVSGLGLPGAASPYLTSGAARRQRRRARRAALAAGVVGAAAIATTLAVVFTFIDSKGTTTAIKADAEAGSNIIPVSTTSLTSTPVVGHDVMQLVDAVRPSLVGLEPLDGSGPVRMTGVVLPGGAYVVTAASAVAGASQIDVVTASGKRMRGHVVGSDPHSGVAVISTDGGLTPATFSDEDVQQNDLDIMVCLCTDAPTSSSSGATPAAAVGMVQGVGSGVALDSGINLVNTIQAEMPLGPTSWGGVLLDSHGRVLGILDGQMSLGNDTIGLFVPAPLAEGVGLELARTHRVDHGWLGVKCTDPVASSTTHSNTTQTAQGAEVATILPGSPAVKAGLEPGDIVMAVDTHHVDSVADLQERLYTVAPGTTVQLHVARAAGQAVVAVKLADTPGG